MNFVRGCEPRCEDAQKAEQMLFDTTVREYEIAKKFDIPCTFLIQYDALIDERYIDFFKSVSNDKVELGLWYEIPKQLLDSVSLPWRGKEGWTWDWHIVPGFSMAYTKKEREKLIDSAMGEFKKVFGYYPKSVASWLIDSYTVEILSKKYNVSYIGICRDQIETDAYDLVGGYFNGGYFPSVKNMFTPAQTQENRLSSPVFRLLGPDPIHNYDNEKYMFDKDNNSATLYTLEPAWETGRKKNVVQWYDKTYFRNESLEFAYAQIGQENSFAAVGEKMFDALEMQIETFKKNKDIAFLTTSQVGELFKKSYKSTPPTCVFASDDWESGENVQSLCYSCERYTANLFRFGKKVFIRYIYLFDEDFSERYLDEPCTTWNAKYENLPVCDTLIWKNNKGILLDCECGKFFVEKINLGEIKAFWNDSEIVFAQNNIFFKNVSPIYDVTGNKSNISVSGNTIKYLYEDKNYAIQVKNALPKQNDGKIIFDSDGCFEIQFV